MRAIAERVLRNTALPPPNGQRIWVSLDSQLKHLRLSGFDADLVQLARDHVQARSVVWDIGANFGVFAFSAARARSVVAVEAGRALPSTLVVPNDSIKRLRRWRSIPQSRDKNIEIK